MSEVTDRSHGVASTTAAGWLRRRDRPRWSRPSPEMPSTPDKLCLRFEGQEWTYGHERVVAAVVRVDPGLTAEKKFCRRDLAGYKEPRGVVFVDALSRSALGKVLKHEVRDQPSESEE